MFLTTKRSLSYNQGINAQAQLHLEFISFYVIISRYDTAPVKFIYLLKRSLRPHQSISISGATQNGLRGLDESFVEKTPGDKYVCDICDYQTVHKSNLTRHQKTHWDAPETPELQHFLCNVCGKGYKSAMAYPYTLKVCMKTLSNINVKCATSNRTRFGTIRATLPSMILH